MKIILGLWVFITLLPALLVNNKLTQKVLTTRDYIGIAVWIFGFVFEVVADYQKLMFKKDPNSAVCAVVYQLLLQSCYMNFYVSWSIFFQDFSHL